MYIYIYVLNYGIMCSVLIDILLHHSGIRVE